MDAVLPEGTRKVFAAGQDARNARAAWHALAPRAALDELGARETGLGDAEAVLRRARVGPNALPRAPRRPLALIFLRQLASPLIYLLLLAAVLAWVLGQRGDAIVVLAVVLLNSVIGAVQEGRAERSMGALRRISRLRARALRAGVEVDLEAVDLVPGDVVLLAAGDAVPADARLLDAAGLEAGEAALTGESLPIAKQVAPVDAAAALPDRASMLYAGTFVTAGRARALVVATGLATEVGRIASLAEGAREPRTPLQRRLERLGQQLVGLALVVFVLVLATGLASGLPFAAMLMVALSQLVSIVPEGLPVATTIALATGMQRMARRRAIVRRLAAVETLGSTTVICTDKTGTLTRNEITVTELALPGGRTIDVSGGGYAPRGELREGGRPAAGDDPQVRALLEAFVLASDAELVPPGAGESRWCAAGDPTEAALVTAACKAGVVAAQVRAAHPRRGEVPFDPATRRMATAHDGFVLIKGAPEVVVALCAVDPAVRAGILAQAEGMARRALRVLAVARVDGASLEAGVDALAGRAAFLGLCGEIDPPREEVKDAIAACHRAGVRVVMVTGDHKATAVAIARQLGIERPGDVALDGSELAALDDDALARVMGRVVVFARVLPAQKLRIVEALAHHGDVVAMTGDGVNDAPALARAHVGVAMGLGGTEVAKEAAAITITDDDFATIVAAVEEGRLAYRNLKKIILFLLSTGLAEVVVLLAAMALGYPMPFAAVMILWNNLITEGTITVNLAVDPRQGDEMLHPPVARGEPLLGRRVLGRMAFMSLAIACLTFTFYVTRLAQGVVVAQASTETFALLAVCEWFNLLNCRSEVRSALNLGFLRNHWLVAGLVVSNLMLAAVIFLPFANRVFHTVPIPLASVLVIGVVGSGILWAEEARKALVRRALRRRSS